MIFVVEDKKLHVYRVRLSMNSPVFKAMFKSQFKEATANEFAQRLVFLPTPLSCCTRLLHALQQIRAQSRLLYLLITYIIQAMKMSGSETNWSGFELRLPRLLVCLRFFEYCGSRPSCLNVTRTFQNRFPGP